MKSLDKVMTLLKSKSESEAWQRNLVLMIIAQFIAMVGMNAFVPFLPLYIIELGIKNPSEAKFWSSMIFAGPYMLSIIGVPIWGALGDRYGQKPMVVRAIFGLGIAVFLMGFATNVYQLFAFRVLQGAVSGFIAAALAFTSKNTPSEKSGYAIGLLQGASSAGIIVGPFFGGIFADVFGTRPVFFIVATLCVISGLLIMTKVKEMNKTGKNPDAPSVFDNLKFVSKKPKLIMAMNLIILCQAGVLFTYPIFPYYVAELGAPKEYLSSLTGFLVAIIGIFSIIFAPWWGKRTDRKDYRDVLKLTILASAIGMIAHAVVHHYLWLFPVRGILGVFYSGVIPTLYTLINKNLDDGNKGGIMGLASSSTLFGSLMSFLLSSYLSPKIEMVWNFYISAILLFVAFCIIYIYSYKEVEHER